MSSLKSSLLLFCCFSLVVPLFAEASHSYDGRCDVARMKFSVSSATCDILKSTSSGVVIFGVNADDMSIVAPGKAQGNHVIVRIRRVEIPVARSQIGLRGFEPVSISDGRSKYEVRGRVIYTFIDKGGEVVYVSRGLNTYEGNRILSGSVELLYQFDIARDDFEVLNEKLLKLIESIGIH
ncbi:hypothetical protein [Pseudomonas capsici]|uniref:Uncharacterized protein n=1 Tax=Pseudomonas capsici TaxID=2810614 RepID=A0ABT3BTX6_9PSED|nr:hypothetical protein [Pseudomonas capsici]MBX8610448.1 hypothetical protein [Pseudomonas cichorii]MBN6712951.1 hypothetical protein [Pseudomonas capsici]MBN6717943.1 hypothetical protein [Pseudomonas capsici]MBN6722401.1 hypothetical protein [Pseudomonas capsici]MCV4266962.1 hypothetical protein [Pseudomonas capsici]